MGWDEYQNRVHQKHPGILNYGLNEETVNAKPLGASEARNTQRYIAQELRKASTKDYKKKTQSSHSLKR